MLDVVALPWDSGLPQKVHINPPAPGVSHRRIRDAPRASACSGRCRSSSPPTGHRHAPGQGGRATAQEVPGGGGAKRQRAVDSCKVPQLGAFSHPFFGWEGSPTKIGCRKMGTLFLGPLSTGGPRLMRGAFGPKPGLEFPGMRTRSHCDCGLTSLFLFF